MRKAPETTGPAMPLRPSPDSLLQAQYDRRARRAERKERRERRTKKKHATVRHPQDEEG